MTFQCMSLDSMPEFHSKDLVQLNLESSSKGNQKKWVTFDSSLYIKECLELPSLYCRDDLVEVIASKFLSLCRDVYFVDYKYCTVDGRPAVMSQNFLADKEEFVSYYRLLQLADIRSADYWKKSAQENFEELVSTVESLTGLHLDRYFYSMAIIDYLIGNEDRHYNNFGVIRSCATGKFRGAPLFDFGLGMFEHDTKYKVMAFKECVDQLNGKPFSYHSENLLKFFSKHTDWNESILPREVCASQFQFPSLRGRRLFIERAKKLGMEVIE